MPSWLTDPFTLIGGALLVVMFLVIRGRMGDAPRTLFLGSLAWLAIWVGVSWTAAIGGEAPLALLLIAAGHALVELAWPRSAKG
jgi:hypothetical protein